jgi:hypothetical protein
LTGIIIIYGHQNNTAQINVIFVVSE